MNILRYITERRFSLIEYVALSVCIALLNLDQWLVAFAVLIGCGLLSALLGAFVEKRQ